MARMQKSHGGHQRNGFAISAKLGNFLTHEQFGWANFHRAPCETPLHLTWAEVHCKQT
jgi:hypothetical protein